MSEPSSAAGTSQAASSNDEKEECVFCLDVVNDKDAAFSTQCPLHVSHKYCLLRWLETNRSCATCRTEVVAVKQKSGKNVALPPLRPLDPDDPRQPDIPHLNDEEFINAELTSDEEEDEDEDFETDAVVVARAGLRPTRRSARQSGAPLRMTAAERAREDMIARMTGMVAAGVGSTRRGRGVLRVSATSRRAVASAATRRRAPAAPTVDLDELEERLEGELRAGRQGRGRTIVYSDSEAEDEQSAPSARSSRRARLPSNSDEDVHEEQAPTRRAIESSEEGEETESGSEGSETGSEESENSDEGEEASDGSELDERVLDDDQPSTSRSMVPIVRKKRSVKKRETKTKGGTVKRRSTKRMKTTKKGVMRGTKRRRASPDASQPRIRDLFPPLSLNGAGLEPIIDEDEVPSAPKRARVSDLPTPPPTAAAPADPTDLLGSILTSQVVAHAPGRYLQQRDGKLVPRENFSRHLDKMEKRGALPVDRAEVTPLTASTPSSSIPPTSSRAASSSTTRNGNQSSLSSTASKSKNGQSRVPPSRCPPTSASLTLPRLVPLVSKVDRSTPLPPPPLPIDAAPRLKCSSSSNQSVDSDGGGKVDSKVVTAEMKQQMFRDRCLQIRASAESILNGERREGRISAEEHKQLVIELLKKLSGKPSFDRKEVVVWSKIMLGRLLLEKMQ
ncbi:hypothetical protein PMAYCL1PPCAC_30625 [Pristionchus mayeri]|uniref:RING-type domain-containing protein n=1 Tax=Pristionchus mayeri TaxID=1317129 RepID=A0AAN5DE42_9BILA|nr:hypothetical protein PMAYCL1PPCAC_30625 [Pristionchus mayeri]